MVYQAKFSRALFERLPLEKVKPTAGAFFGSHFLVGLGKTTLTMISPV